MRIRQTPNTKARSKLGADFCRLPENEQAEILRAMFSVGSQWHFLTDVIDAEPGRKIAMVREMRNLTQAQLAEMAQVRQADVSAAENCIDSVKIGVLRRIAESLNVALQNLLF